MPESPLVPSPRRRRKNAAEDRSEMPLSSFLPTRNRPARWAYICTALSLIPGLALLTGLPAFVLGRIGRRRYQADENVRGLGHSLIAMVVGPTAFVLNAIGVYLIYIGLNEN